MVLRTVHTRYAKNCISEQAAYLTRIGEPGEAASVKSQALLRRLRHSADDDRSADGPGSGKSPGSSGDVRIAKLKALATEFAAATPQYVALGCSCHTPPHCPPYPCSTLHVARRHAHTPPRGFAAAGSVRRRTSARASCVIGWRARACMSWRSCSSLAPSGGGESTLDRLA